MNDQNPIIIPTKAMIEAYEKLLKFTVKEAKLLEDKTGPALHKLIDTSTKKISELGDVTEEEAEKISTYLKRDLTEAATYMSETGHDFKKWLALDTLNAEIIEDYVIDLFKHAADQTRIELDKIRFAAETAEYHTGEITGPGVLLCDNCGENLHFEKAGHIPPCPKCKKSRFHRLLRSEQ